MNELDFLKDLLPGLHGAIIHATPESLDLALATIQKVTNRISRLELGQHSKNRRGDKNITTESL